MVYGGIYRERSHAASHKPQPNEDSIEKARMLHWWFTVIFLFTIIVTTGNIYGANAFVSTLPRSNEHRPRVDPLLGKRPTMRATVVCLGRKVTIRIVGRKQGGEEWLEDACDMYLQRLKPTGFEVHTEWYKNNEALLKVHQEQSSSSSSQSKYVPIVLLDPTGIRCTSESFSDKVYQWLQEGGSRLVFVIGGADGLPTELKQGSSGNGKKPILLSLSDLTFTHQFARLVLIEQIYRATEIQKGSSYHR